jgi:hypothetical protein
MLSYLADSDSTWKFALVKRIREQSAGETFVAGTERQRELRRRRARREKLTKLKSKLSKATQSEKAEIVRKLRDLTPGAEVIIQNWELAEAAR